MLSTFIKLRFSIKTFVLSFFEWPLKTGFTVIRNDCHMTQLYGHIDVQVMSRMAVGFADEGSSVYQQQVLLV